MALNSYAALKASIADFLNRSDLTAVIPDFITLAEAEMNRRIRMAALVKRADATIDSEYTSFPSDLQQIKSLYLKTSPITKLVFLTVEEMQAKKASGYKTTGNPDFFFSHWRHFSSAASAGYRGDCRTDLSLEIKCVIGQQYFKRCVDAEPGRLSVYGFKTKRTLPSR